MCSSDLQFAAVHIICFIAKQIEKLRVDHADEEIKGGIRVRHDEEQRRFLIAQRVQLQLIVHSDTRMEGRTPVPEGERLAALAAHGATMVIFLSIGLIDRVQDALLQGAYTAATPAAVVYKATWPEQKIVHCTVGTLAESTRAAGITKTALIVVGDFLAAQYDRSKLYDPAFTTEFRRGTDR